MPGIGPINALGILAEAGDLRRFGHVHAIIKSGADYRPFVEGPAPASV